MSKLVLNPVGRSRSLREATNAPTLDDFQSQIVDSWYDKEFYPALSKLRRGDNTGAKEGRKALENLMIHARSYFAGVPGREDAMETVSNYRASLYADLAKTAGVRESATPKGRPLKESLLSDLRAAGVPDSDIDHHASDLYVRVTPKSKSVIDAYEYKSQVKTFTDNIDKAKWYEIPFGRFDDFAKSKQRPMQEAARSVVDEDAARELVLYAENERGIYDVFQRSYLPNILRKMKRGVWDPEKGVVLIGYLMDQAARDYVRENGSTGDNLANMFNKATRLAAAREYLAVMQDEIDAAAAEAGIGQST